MTEVFESQRWSNISSLESSFWPPDKSDICSLSKIGIAFASLCSLCLLFGVEQVLYSGILELFGWQLVPTAAGDDTDVSSDSEPKD